MKNRIELGQATQPRARNVFGGAAILTAALLLTAPCVAEAEESPDRDPFDRPGFYIGAGASYQYNAFSNQIEDAIEDEFAVKTDVDLDDSWGVNALLGYRVWSWFALELQYEWVDEYDIKGSTNVPVPVSGKLYSIEGHTLTANTKWIIPFWRVQPYFLLGGGVAISDVNDGNLDVLLTTAGISINGGTHTKPAARAGLGLDLYITKHIVLNAQASAVVTTLKEPDIGDVDDLNYMAFAAGLQYRF
jgi:opacity protein-like surface antigen